MGLEIFGTISFTSETKAGDFVKFLQDGKFKTTQCRNCDKIYFPPRVDCGACESSMMDWIEITDSGELVAYSTIMYGPTGFENEVPYTIGVIKLANGVQIFGRLSKKISLNEIEIGIKLKVVPTRLPLDRVSFEFVRSD